MRGGCVGIISEEPTSPTNEVVMTPHNARERITETEKSAAPRADDSSSSRESQEAMTGTTLEQALLITNPNGFHLRPAAAFAETARKFQCQVTIRKDSTTVNGKSPLDLLVLAAAEGTELILEVSGADAEAALKALVDLLTTLEVIRT